jgi:energy-coupling factor transport system permease protein
MTIISNLKAILTGPPAPLQAKTWLIWAAAAMLPALLTQNPYYLLGLIAVAGINYFGLAGGSPIARGWGAFLRLGLVMVAFSVIFNVLTVSAGATPLFTLPEFRWETAAEQGQMTVIRLGGKVSLESLVYGLTTGLALMALLLVFATFNAQVDHYQLLRAIPPFLYQSAVVASIAITFIPQMFTAQQEIRQAQMLRGHRFRGLKDMPPLFVTLLAEGLEHSLTLAESMEARGYGSQPGATAQPGLILKSLIALALLLLAAGALSWSYFANPRPGIAVAALGGVLLAAGIGVTGRRVQRSRYRRVRRLPQDTLAAGAAGAVAALYLGMWGFNQAALIFYPYPRLYWPDFDPLLGGSLLLLLLPTLLARLPGEKNHD